MASAIRMNLSGCTDGKPLKIAATGSPGTLVHTATSSATRGAGGTWDEVWVWAYNASAVSVSASSLLMRVQFGAATNPDNLIEVTLPCACGPFLIVPGLVLQNSTVVRAYGGGANLFTVFGFVNRITN